MPTETTDGWNDVALQAYHDGELGWWARRRVERNLARSPELRRTLEEITALGALVRESEAPAASVELWDSLAGGLRIADAERDEAGRVEARPGPLGWLGGRVGALATAGALGAALAFALVTNQTGSDAAVQSGVVHWVDGGNRNVMLLDDESDITVIWVFDSVTERARRGGRRGTA